MTLIVPLFIVPLSIHATFTVEPKCDKHVSSMMPPTHWSQREQGGAGGMGDALSLDLVAAPSRFNIHTMNGGCG